MKLRSIICAVALIACFTATASADAIGVRLSGGSFFGGELNYQKNMGSSNRLELGLSYDDNSSSYFGYKYSAMYLGLVGIYQWKWDNLGGVNGLNWYVGPGAAVQYFMWSYKYTYTSELNNSGGDIYANIGGQIGIEFDFDFPLNLSLDVRPMFGLLHSAGFGWAAGLGIRYTF